MCDGNVWGAYESWTFEQFHESNINILGKNNDLDSENEAEAVQRLIKTLCSCSVTDSGETDISTDMGIMGQ